MPAEIAGIGSTQQKLRVRPGFDPMKAGVGPEEYFVLSRIDGTQSLREVILATGLPVERGVTIVQRLRSIGALLLPGETAPPAQPPPRAAAAPLGSASRAPTAQPTSASGSGNMSRAATASPVASSAAKRAPTLQTPALEIGPVHDLSLPRTTAEELAALAEVVDLDDKQRRKILAMARLADGRDPYALLGIPPASDARTIKRAYFALSKEVHPDRFFGRRVGSFGPRMTLVFEATSRAYARLTSSDPRSATKSSSVSQQQPQTPQEYASELFDRACQLEVGGDALGAMKMFAAAVRIDPQVRYLRRAASCALAAEQPRTAVEYAKKANSLMPNDPSSARLLAAAFRAAGKLNDAEEVLVMAMALKSENDVLTAELRNDLAEVRRLLAT